VLVFLFALLTGIPPQTEVLRSLPDKGIVGISSGTAEGVAEKDRFVVLRNGIVIAEGEVIRAGEHAAICRITRREGGQFPNDGDQVRAPGAAAAPAGKEKPDTPQAPAPPIGSKLRNVSPRVSRAEELLAVGVCGDLVCVSSTEGVYRLLPGAFRRDESVLPHHLLRFVSWGDKLWAETTGGVFLLEKGRWSACNWTERFATQTPAFARIACNAEYSWGSFANRLLFYDTQAMQLNVTPAARTTSHGVWVTLGESFPEEIEALLARRDGTLAFATAARKIHVREKGFVRQLCELAFTTEDPLVLELAEDADKALWGLSCAPNGGVFKVVDSAAVLVPRGKGNDPGAIPEGRLLRLLTAPNGVVHVLHATEGVFRLADGAWKRIGERPAERALDMAFQGERALLLTERKLIRLGEQAEELFVLEE
jgi:hypothetical protein